MDARAYRYEDPPVVTLLDNGPPEMRIDIVVVGDGYGSSGATRSMDDYRADIESALLPPFIASGNDEVFYAYRRFFNIHRVNLISVADTASPEYDECQAKQAPGAASPCVEDEAASGMALCSKRLGTGGLIADFGKLQGMLDEIPYPSASSTQSVLDIADLVVVLNARGDAQTDRSMGLSYHLMELLQTTTTLESGCDALLTTYPWYDDQLGMSLVELANSANPSVNWFENQCYLPTPVVPDFTPLVVLPYNAPVGVYVHELGHALADLGDEYPASAGPCMQLSLGLDFGAGYAQCNDIPLRYDYDVLEASIPNLDLHSTCQGLDRARWCDSYWDPSPENYGAFQLMALGGNCSSPPVPSTIYTPLPWYDGLCRMVDVSHAFCDVCRDAIVRAIYAHPDVADGTARLEVSEQAMLSLPANLRPTGQFEWQSPTWNYRFCPHGETPDTATCPLSEDRAPNDTERFVIDDDPGNPYYQRGFIPNTVRDIHFKVDDHTSWVRDYPLSYCTTCQSHWTWQVNTHQASEYLACMFEDWCDQNSPNSPTYAMKVASDLEFHPSAVAVGDLDGNGMADVVIADETGSEGSVYERGMVYVLLNPSSLPDWNQGDRVLRLEDNGRANFMWLIGANAYDHAGASLAVGDFDGDGKDDLAIGAPGYDVYGAPNAGAVYVLTGFQAADSGQTVYLSSLVPSYRSRAMMLWGKTAKESVGSVLAFVEVLSARPGELSSAYGLDLVMSAVDTAASTGIVYVLQNSSVLIGRLHDPAMSCYFGVYQQTPWYNPLKSVANVLRIHGNGGDHLGDALASGNLDGEPGDELVLSAATAPSSSDDGLLYVLTKLRTISTWVEGYADVDLSQASVFRQARIQGNGGEMAGFSIDVGDVDADGFDDLLVGAPYYTNYSMALGMGYVVYGEHNMASYAGASAYSLPDMNVLGTYYGERVALLGYASGPSQAGWAMRAAHLDGDEWMDVVVGLPWYDFKDLTDGGLAYVERGGHGLRGYRETAHSPDWLISPELLGGLLSSALDVGDMDGDGADDIAVSADDGDDGFVYLILGDPQ